MCVRNAYAHTLTRSFSLPPSLPLLPLLIFLFLFLSLSPSPSLSLTLSLTTSPTPSLPLSLRPSHTRTGVLSNFDSRLLKILADLELADKVPYLHALYVCLTCMRHMLAGLQLLADLELTGTSKWY